MILHVYSDAAYKIMPKACRRILWYYHLAGKPNTPQQFQLNGPLLIKCKTIQYLVASAIDVEIWYLSHNSQTRSPIKTFLEALVYTQPPISTTTDNATTHGFIYDTINLKKSKNCYTKYYWLRKKISYLWNYETMEIKMTVITS